MYGVLAVFLSLALADIEHSTHTAASHAAAHTADDEYPYSDEQERGTDTQEYLPQARFCGFIVKLSAETLSLLLRFKKLFYLVDGAKVDHDVWIRVHLLRCPVEDFAYILRLHIHLQLAFLLVYYNLLGVSMAYELLEVAV